MTRKKSEAPAKSAALLAATSLTAPTSVERPAIGGPAWSTACPDWEERIVERKSLIPFAPLFPDEGKSALAVFKSLRMVDVPGQPTFGEACDQWVFDFVEAIFGAYDAKAGKRLIREFLLLISKKNSKSTIAAGIMLTALIRNWRLEAELLIIAPTKEVAENSFNPAAAMVRADPVLSIVLHVQEHLRTIKHRKTKAVLKVVAADTEIVSGKKAGFVLVEELWIFGKRANAESMLREATGGLVSRDEGFVIYLTTHSDEPPAGIWKTKLEYARDVRDGKIVNNAFLAVLYEWSQKMLEEQAYLDPDNFYVTNPNLGRSVNRDWLEEELVKERLQGDGAVGLQIFLAKHLNVEIGLRLRRDRWRGADYWEAAGAPEVCADLDAMLARCEVAVVGGDGGGLDDLFGTAVVGRDKRTGVWLYWFHAFAHRKVLEIRKEIAPLLLGFEKDGDLTFWGDENAATKGVAAWLAAAGSDEDETAVERPEASSDEDVAGFVAVCLKVRKSGLLPENSGIGLDPAMIGAVVDALVAAEFTISTGTKGDIVSVSQSVVNMFSAINTLERKLEGGTAAHGGTKLMAWVVSNAKTELRGNSVAITKAVAGKAKIDPLVAGFVATKLMERNPEAANDRRPYADGRGLLMVG
jgi:phage terminase large subunit-like protein